MVFEERIKLRNIESKVKNDEVIHVVGAGVAGLFCADQLIKAGHKVILYDHETGPGKKFLVAGNGGLNLTHSEEIEQFCPRYGVHEKFFRHALDKFSPTDLRDWCLEMGVDTFVGTSGRVFPTKLKAAEILLTLRKRLEVSENFNFQLKTRFLSLDVDKKQKVLTFEGPEGRFEVTAEKVIFALGGGSWAKTGSDGKWVNSFKSINLNVAPLMAMNCGFKTNWSNHFKGKVERLPLKNVSLKFKDKELRTEVMVTDYGIEGTGIYALSNLIRDEILLNNKATITIDLRPDIAPENIEEKISTKRPKESVANFLRKAFGLSSDAVLLLREFVPSEKMNCPIELTKIMKNMRVELTGVQPIDEAISTSGGVCFDQLNEHLEHKSYSGLFFVGEMLDFEAPTGGYLIQAAISTAYLACQKIINGNKSN